MHCSSTTPGLRDLPKANAERVLKTQKKRLVVRATDYLQRPFGKQICEVSLALRQRQVFIQVGQTAIVVVREIIRRASVDAEEFVEAMTIWTELRNISEVPFTNEKRLVSGLLHQGPDGRVVRRNANLRISI